MKLKNILKIFRNKVFILPAIMAAAATFFLLVSCATVLREYPGEKTPYTLSAWHGKTTVETLYGKIRGDRADSDPSVLQWRGIPYAQPPVGALRWRAPQDPFPWKGVRQALSFSRVCMQYTPLSKGKTIIGSEDCLYLNVWRPDTKEENLPVYVWIHGGGNSTGSAAMLDAYYGDRAAKKLNAVYVSLNYRLGPFGWFTNPGLRKTAGSALDASGNYGLLDIMKALEWIQKNIRAFGGDPQNVLVSGESAGGINIISLLMSPLSEGLFQKALIRSGGVMTSSTAQGDADSERVLQKLSEKYPLPKENTAEYLRSIPARDILSCYSGRQFGMIAMPLNFLDGTVLPKEGAKVFRSGEYKTKVPIIIGTNKDETKLFYAWSKQFQDHGAFYQAANSYASNLWKVDGADELARQLSSHQDQPPVYVYQFKWGSLDENGSSVLPGNRGVLLGACHGLEVPFFSGYAEDSLLFDLFFFSARNRPGRIALEKAVLSYLHQFLLTGAPGFGTQNTVAGTVLPEWKQWTDGEDSGKCLLLDAGYRSLDIRMSPLALTRARAKEILRKTVDEPLYNRVLQFVGKGNLNLKNLEN